MSPALLAAADDAKEASPIALVLILALLIAIVFLIRSMNKHLGKMRTTFEERDRPPAEDATAPGADAAGPDAR